MIDEDYVRKLELENERLEKKIEYFRDYQNSANISINTFFMVEKIQSRGSNHLKSLHECVNEAAVRFYEQLGAKYPMLRNCIIDEVRVLVGPSYIREQIERLCSCWGITPDRYYNPTLDGLYKDRHYPEGIL